MRMDRRRPVVFIHGLFCNRGFWHPWMRMLHSQGIPYLSVNLEPVMGGIDGFVAQLEEAVSQLEAVAEGATALPPVLVCHSMGGLVARAWLASATTNRQRIHHIITVGTPHQGTWLARWSHIASGRQMRIGSEWLASLKTKETSSLAQPAPFTCWYSNADNIVFPPTTATLPGADNRLVLHTGHVALAFHPTVMRESLTMMESGASSPMLRTDA
jgi:triacylglycerol lipase